MSDDPERARIDALLDQVTRGAVSDAETEELALYAASDPALREEIVTRARQADLGAGWLARVEADHAIAQVESSGRARVERGLGLALMAGGFVASTLAGAVSPVLGPALLLLGLTILVWSFARVRLATFASDPYKDVQR
ncbi:MAG: hypothetical protein H6713_02035 [Myxococcales bacterium]|nr:hypothetical protein [Myxococcales bacterium]